MSSDVLIAVIPSLLTLVGVIITVVCGNIKHSKELTQHTNLTIYRLDQLEKKVEKHNSVVERTYILEGQMKECQNDIKEIKSKDK